MVLQPTGRQGQREMHKHRSTSSRRAEGSMLVHQLLHLIIYMELYHIISMELQPTGIQALRETRAHKGASSRRAKGRLLVHRLQSHATPGGRFPVHSDANESQQPLVRLHLSSTSAAQAAPTACNESVLK